MKVKIYYTKVIEQEIDIDDKFSTLDLDDADMLTELCNVGWTAVYKDDGDELLTMKTSDGEVLLEL